MDHRVRSVRATCAVLTVVVCAAVAAEPPQPVDCRDSSLLRRAPDLTPPEWDPQTPYVKLTDWAGYDEVDLGLGHLRPVGDHSSDWWYSGDLRLPLHDAPGEAAWGWFVNGWLVLCDGPAEPRALGSEGLVETGYEVATFVVLDVRDEGWLRLRYGKPDGQRDGTAWVHRCQLPQGGAALRLERWEERLLSDTISPLYFRSGTPHVLRAEPDSGSAKLALIEGDYHLDPLEIDGDWMRVRLVQPSNYCADVDEPTVREGWVRWRSTDKGPWVWYYTRGC